jgi:hypothetical protein
VTDGSRSDPSQSVTSGSSVFHLNVKNKTLIELMGLIITDLIRFHLLHPFYPHSIRNILN